MDIQMMAVWKCNHPPKVKIFLWMAAEIESSLVFILRKGNGLYLKIVKFVIGLKQLITFYFNAPLQFFCGLI